jgi:hypothetical protein
LAASIASGALWVWLINYGWLPVVLSASLSLVASATIFALGWGIIRGMVIFCVIFITVVAVTRTVLGGLLPAMPGLVSIFIITGAMVGYLTALEEGD